MKLIVGLGNFPEAYKNTRHNVGFMCVDHWLNKNRLSLITNKFNGWFTKSTNDDGNEFIIAKPYTYMNLSGQFVFPLANFFKIPVDDILIICDDVDIDVGEIRIKPKGGANGQKGLKNIIDQFATENIKRIRIGIGRPINKQDMINYVIGKFHEEEIDKLSTSINKACTIIDDFINDVAFDKIMSKYND